MYNPAPPYLGGLAVLAGLVVLLVVLAGLVVLLAGLAVGLGAVVVGLVVTSRSTLAVTRWAGHGLAAFLGIVGAFAVMRRLGPVVASLVVCVVTASDVAIAHVTKEMIVGLVRRLAGLGPILVVLRCVGVHRLAI